MIEILYFDIKGRAEGPRLALTIGDIPFKDERFEFSEFPAMKSSGRLPFGQVPVLTTEDGAKFTQSDAILRYCGKLGGLYPRDNDVAAMAIDEVMNVVGDVQAAIFKYRGPDKEKLKETREEVVKNEMPRFLGGLEKLVKEKATSETWVVGNSITIADLVIYYTFGNVMHGFVDHVTPEALQGYPRLMASYEAVLNHPKVVSWNEKHPWKK